MPLLLNQRWDRVALDVAAAHFWMPLSSSSRQERIDAARKLVSESATPKSTHTVA